MLRDTALIKTEEGWKFESEADLEDFVWDNLNSLLALTSLKRQFYVKTEVCDILALGQNGQLVVLELKNGEDRYIVQQLTRYYESLLEEKPFETEVDYRLPISLVAIAPKFHRHNFIDSKYHNLDFKFLLFEILQKENKLYLNLKNPDGAEVSKLRIPYPEEYIIDSSEKVSHPIKIPRTPKALQRMIETQSIDKQSTILNIREKILRFDERMVEKSTDVTITYGKKNGKGQLCKTLSTLCAAFRYSTSNCISGNILHNIELFLYLPFPKEFASQRIMKVLIVTPDWQTIARVQLPYRYKEPWRHGECWNIEKYIKTYEQITGKLANSNSLDALIDIALEQWLYRQK